MERILGKKHTKKSMSFVVVFHIISIPIMLSFVLNLIGYSCEGYIDFNAVLYQLMLSTATWPAIHYVVSK